MNVPQHFVFQDTLMVMEISPKIKPTDQKFRERKVFLFEQIVIISEEVDKKKSDLCSSSFIFKNNLMVRTSGSSISLLANGLYAVIVHRPLL